MKIFHTADWHLGKKLEGYSRLNEQTDVLAEICAIAEKENPDVVIIAGDIYDTYNPPTEAVELFYKTVKKLSRNASVPVVVIAGNHDSPDRIEAVDPLAVENGIFLLGYPDSFVKKIKLDSGLEILNSTNGFLEFKLPKTDEKLRIIFTPYANEYRLKTALDIEKQEEELKILLAKKWDELAQRFCDNQGVNILISHNFFIKKGEKPVEESDDEKPILYVGGAQAIEVDLIPSNMQYVALGHLHRFHNVNSESLPVVYSGSPLSYSFAEAEQQKYIVAIDAKPGQLPVINRIKLKSGKKLVRKRFDDIDKAVQWLGKNQNSLLELTISTDTYLSSSDRKRLFSAHQGILSIIPDIKNKDGENQNSRFIDLQQSRTELFKKYFKYKKAEEPNERIIGLFNELIS